MKKQLIFILLPLTLFPSSASLCEYPCREAYILRCQQGICDKGFYIAEKSRGECSSRRVLSPLPHRTAYITKTLFEYNKIQQPDGIYWLEDCTDFSGQLDEAAQNAENYADFLTNERVQYYSSHLNWYEVKQLSQKSDEATFKAIKKEYQIESVKDIFTSFLD